MKSSIKARLLTASLLVEGPEVTVTVCGAVTPSMFSCAVRSLSLALADLTTYKKNKITTG